MIHWINFKQLMMLGVIIFVGMTIELFDSARAHESGGLLVAQTTSSASAPGERDLPANAAPKQDGKGLSQLLPHGVCILWDESLLLLHVISDAVIALAYFSIPIALVVFIRRRKDLAFSWIFGMFALFIVACGTTHIMGIWTIWRPVYWLDGTVKALTAMVSIITAIFLWPLIPKALALPSPAHLEMTNRELQIQIKQRIQAQEETLSKVKDLAAVNEDLEHYNRLAMGREKRILELKLEVNELVHNAGKPRVYDLPDSGEYGQR
jgi:hypothetical protein